MRKRIFKLFALLFIVLTLGVTSCSMEQANVYNYWKINGTEYLSQDHVVKKISVNKLISMVQKQGTDDAIIYVFFGQTDSTTSRSAIKVYNEQAIQYEIPVLYWVDSNLSDSKIDKLEDSLSISDATNIPSIFAFDNGAIAFDSSRPVYKNDTSIQTIELAEVVFKNLYDEDGNYDF